MAGETLITVVGNLTADPELRRTQSGKSVVNFTVASTPSTFNRQSNSWEDGEALFLRCSQWNDAAEHVASSLSKGARVIVQGYLKQRSYQDREGNNRTAIELEVAEVGPSLRFATAAVTRVARGHGGGQRQQPANDPWANQQPVQQPQQDAWSQPAAYDDETPF